MFKFSKAGYPCPLRFAHPAGMEIPVLGRQPPEIWVPGAERVLLGTALSALLKLLFPIGAVTVVESIGEVLHRLPIIVCANGRHPISLVGGRPSNTPLPVDHPEQLRDMEVGVQWTRRHTY